MRSSSALVAHIHAWMRRYSARLARPPVSVACALTAEGHRDFHDLLGANAHAFQVVVVEAVEFGEVLPLGAVLAQPLRLFDDAAHQLRLRPYATLSQSVLDDDRTGVLAVHVADLLSQVLRRDELVDRRVDQHSRGMDAGFVAEDVETDAWFGR